MHTFITKTYFVETETEIISLPGQTRKQATNGMNLIRHPLTKSRIIVNSRFIYLLTLCLKIATGNRNSLGQLLRNHYMINKSMINL